jgi:cysteine-rich repeat protein
MNRRYWLLLCLASVGAALSTACSSEFSSCETRRKCPHGGAGGMGDAGAAGEAGSPAGEGGSDSGNGGPAGSGGEGGAEEPTLFGTCWELGRIACSGHGTAQRIACDGSKWLAATTCAAGELCDSTSGECAKAVPECVDAVSGEVVCRGDVLLSCGIDLTTASEGKSCAGVCMDGACQKPTCGDLKIEVGEECDDGMSTSGGCGPDCKAICGDGLVLAGYEQCDDKNVVPGDGCSADCKWEPIALSLGGAGSCALSAAGTVKCWGENASGQLGLGDVERRGDDKGELAKLPAIELGAGRTVKAISSGRHTNCALLDNGRVKCWGLNDDGQLGLGDTNNRGDKPGQMGDALPSVALVGNAKATHIASGYRHACAVANDLVQCWGSGVSGELGQGDTATHSQPVGVYDFGKAASVSVSAGGTFTCQLLQTGKIVCWGDNSDGQLSSALTGAIGDSPGEMNELFPLNFSELTTKAIALGIASACAILNDASVRCWGRGDFGQLGTEDPDPHGTLPYSLPSVEPVALGAGRKPLTITAGARHVCVLLDDATVKCWGDNTYGQLGIGSMASVGSTPGTMGDNLKAVALGNGRTARQVVAGENHTCALLDDGTIKCWGRNTEGELGLGDAVNRGTAPNQMADALPAVPLSF